MTNVAGKSFERDGAVDEIHVPSLLIKELVEPFVYCPNPGNAGDALMAKATYDLFANLGVDYGTVDHSSLETGGYPHGKIVVLSGGGNFSEGGYNSYADILARIHKKVKRVIVLPHTIHGNAQLLHELGDNVTLICRERVSYQHVKQHATKARVFLAHDMALLLDVKSALAFKPRYFSSMAIKGLLKLCGSNRVRLYPTFDSYWSGLKWSLGVGRRLSLNPKTANLFRTDIEKTTIALPQDNLDASLAFNFGATSATKAAFTVYHLLKFLDSFDVINTNRLHVAIAAALLGKQVNLSPNSYFKCRAVYEYSLRETFPNVSWCSA
jgi:exopolysaccharide biosynthesis predicted pyruvyltransferase EpsI